MKSKRYAKGQIYSKFLPYLFTFLLLVVCTALAQSCIVESRSRVEAWSSCSVIGEEARDLGAAVGQTKGSYELAKQKVVKNFLSTLSDLQTKFEKKSQKPEEPKEKNAPTFQDLVDSSCSSSNPCGECQGNCQVHDHDRDLHCETGLRCFQRSDHEIVPGCAAGGTKGSGYCYNSSNLPTDHVFHPANLPTFQPDISSLVDVVLKDLTFNQTYDVFVSEQYSDIRDSKSLRKAGPEGYCTDEALSSKQCYRTNWGHRAYNFACSAENTIAWNDPDRKVYGTMHTLQGHFRCGVDPDVCKAMLCTRFEDKAMTRKVRGVSINTGQDLDEFNWPHGMAASLSFKVTCGVRSKIMICPLLKGQITQCSVKKECGTYSNPQPDEMWVVGSRRRGQVLTNTAAKQGVWEKLKTRPLIWKHFDEAATKACSGFCGFY